MENAFQHFGKRAILNEPYRFSDGTYNGSDLQDPENYAAFWYHPDHLGSSSYITNLAGEITQHMEYLPFGETLIEEHMNSNNSPYKFNAKEMDAETGNYYYGARYYNPKWSMWLSVDPLSEKHPSWTPYHYVHNNPIKYIDPDGRDAILIVFPGYKISTPLGKIGGLGHAGVLLIDNKTGITKYYEYGRYDAENKGLTRKVTISNVVIGEDGKPTTESLNKVLGQISTKSGQGGKIEGAYVISDEFEAMNDYAQSKLKENSDPDREPYSLYGNNCGTFAADCINQDETVDQPSIFNPTPTNIVDEYQEEGNARVQYDPKNKTTTIGTGNEKDAKKKDN